MKKRILFVVLQQYADWEAAYVSTAIAVLGEGKYEIKTVSLSKDYVESIGGFRIMPDYDIKSVPNDYEALILIGGMTWMSESAHQLRALVDSCRHEGKILAGICDASAFLGTVGALNEIVHTPENRNILRNRQSEIKML